MNFLSSRREKSKELRKSAEGNQRRAQEKAADTEEEISRFFTARRQNLTETDRDSQPQAPALTKPAHEARSHRKRPAPGESIQRESSYPPVEPPEKPFLGFGSRGLSPVPLVEAHRPPSKAAPLAAPLEGGQPASVRSATYFSWSRSGTQSASPDRQCRKGIVPSREISATPALFNSTISSIEVGKLGQASLHKPRLPDAQREALCKQSPGRRHLGPNELQSSHESRSLRSNPGPSVPSTKGALKPCSNDESSMEHVGDDGDEPSQLEIQDLATKTQNQDDEPSSRHVQRILPLSTQQEDQMQPLNSLLDDCEAALSRIGSKQRDSVSLRQREHLGQLGFNDVNARDRRYSQCNESVPKSGTEESQDAGARNGSWTSPAESALKESDYTVPGNKGVVYSRDGPSGVQAHPDYFARPARQINQVHLQPQSRHYTPTPSLHEVGNPGDCTIRNIKHPANLAYDISQQQSSTAHPTTDPRLHSRDEHLYRTSMGEAKPLRYTDTNHGHWNAYHHPDDPVWTQPEYLYGNIPARVDGPEGHQISLETLEHLPHFDPFSERHVDDAVTRTEFNGAGPDYGYPHLVSASDIQAGQSLWEDESALGDDVLDDEVLDTRDQESQREESHCGRGMDVDVGNDPELEEMPMAAFWRPHRLY